MTQAFNLAQLANNLNTSGQLDATDGLSGAVPVANGGTGRNTLSANQLLTGNGTSPINSIAAGSSGNVLTSNGSQWLSQTPQIIGVGQTWQDQSGIKSVNTTYTNTTGKPIMVSVSQASTGQQNFYINGNYFAQISQNSNNSSAFGFIVPDGDTYRIDTNQPSYWWELR
jgi:hypothetical protein